MDSQWSCTEDQSDACEREVVKRVWKECSSDDMGLVVAVAA